MKIVFVTDYVCPFCIVGKAALLQAARKLGMQLEIETLPMQLTMEPAPRVDTWNNDKKREGYKVLDPAVKELGLPVKFPPYVVPRPYTRFAFEGHFYALENGLADAYDDAMYAAYFIDEKDIGDLAVLAEIAKSVGLDSEEFVQVLQEGRYQKVTQEADTYTKKELGVTSIPTMFIDGKRVQFEDYTIADAEAILKAASSALS